MSTKGKKFSDETRRKMSDAHTGHTVSEKTRARMSKARRLRLTTPRIVKP